MTTLFDLTKRVIAEFPGHFLKIEGHTDLEVFEDTFDRLWTDIDDSECPYNGRYLLIQPATEGDPNLWVAEYSCAMEYGGNTLDWQAIGPEPEVFKQIKENFMPFADGMEDEDEYA